jgi:hypothetical protein
MDEQIEVTLTKQITHNGFEIPAGVKLTLSARRALFLIEHGSAVRTDGIVVARSIPSTTAPKQATKSALTSPRPVVRKTGCCGWRR